MAAAKSLRAAFTKVSVCFLTAALMLFMQLMIKVDCYFIVKVISCCNRPYCCTQSWEIK